MVTALAAVFSPFVGALLMPLLYPVLRRRLGFAALAVAVTALSLVLATPPGTAGTISWVPQLGIDLSLTVDGWGRLMALLITGIGSLVFLYSILYLGAKEDLGKFYLYILLFMGAMLGVVFSANLLLLYVFWELTSISSFLLIGFWYTRESGAYGALKSMLLTVSGGLAMLAGIVLLGHVGGTYEFSALLAQPEVVLNHPLSGPALLLILLGAFSKSAQVPFHIWLPDAMSAPTPVSAYLHSATMVKAGLFLVARIWPLFSAHPYWQPVVATVGLVTMAVGGFLALQKTDLKAILALSTISQLGLIMSLFGFGTREAAVAGVFHLFNHSTFKGLLFMVVGIIDHETGTRDIRRLSGLRKTMPVTAVLAAIGAASMAGVPLLNGFISKEMFLEASLRVSELAALIATGAAIFTTAYCLILAHKIFYGPETHDTPKHPHEAPWLMLLPPALLALIVIAVGIAPGLVEGWLIAPAVEGVVQAHTDFHLVLWHGVTPALFMSLVALGGGLALYLVLPKALPVLRRWTPERIHANALYNWLWWEKQAVEKAAKRITNTQMTGYLRDYLVFVLGATCLVVVATVWIKGIRLPKLDLAPIDPEEAALLLLMIVGAFATLAMRTRLAAIAAIGLVGMPTALYFALMRAPDLALTQLVVEVVTAVLFLLVFAHLPQIKVYPRKPIYHDVNVLVSVGVGMVAMYFTLLGNGSRLFQPEIAAWYLEHSYKLAGGNNVVNVALVDYRGFDTMGEITVLAVTGLAIFTLIRLRLGRTKSPDVAPAAAQAAPPEPDVVAPRSGKGGGHE